AQDIFHEACDAFIKALGSNSEKILCPFRPGTQECAGLATAPAEFVLVPQGRELRDSSACPPPSLGKSDVSKAQLHVLQQERSHPTTLKEAKEREFETPSPVPREASEGRRVPGRAPLCLRCKKTGHIRKDCCVSRCDDCYCYGHTRENCAKAYTVATAGPLPDETTDLIMDEAEAEPAATANASVRTLPTAPRIAEPPTSGIREPSPRVERPSDAPSGEPQRGGMEAPLTTPGKESQLTFKVPEPDGGLQTAKCGC
ncbi:hypothetical protein HPB47_006113, partial [Ixodes persulcatus]